ncbi:MAG: hypothetical protein ABIF85_01935 [Nanoarchaeota archaeon]
MTKNIVVGVIVILALLVIGTTFMGDSQQTQSQEQPVIDLCNEISPPSASVHCSPDCYIIVSGDSRVEYRVYEWGSEGGNTATDVSAGEKQKLSFGTQNSRVEIVPIDFSPRSPAKDCTNKAITIYRSQFSGV